MAVAKADTMRVAQIILREVPVAQWSVTLARLRKPGGEAEFGGGCGGNCGGGNSCLDRFGHSGIPPEAFRKVLTSPRELQTALQGEARKAFDILK